jgi:hypothetical protein
VAKSRTDREAARKRTTEFHDIHDIRALTSTGAITLPQRQSSARTGTTETRD